MLILYPLIKVRNIGSKLLSRRYSAQLTFWQQDVPKDIKALATFCAMKLRWTRDPLNGYLDHIQPIRHMNWQLHHTGILKGDCDDLATWIGYMLKRMGVSIVYRCNIVKHQHVLCIFYDERLGKWRYFSNRALKSGLFTSSRAAVYNWCDRKEKKRTRMYYNERL